MNMLKELIENAQELVRSGYYDVPEGSTRSCRVPSLIHALREHPTFPIIAEVKISSPSNPRVSKHDALELIGCYRHGDAAAISVLTEPNHFRGDLALLPCAASTGLPSLMKDIIVSERQVEAGGRLDASAILLIEKVNGSRPSAIDLDGLIYRAHQLGMEVLLEVSDEEELRNALRRDADLIGINQRNLATMEIDRSKGKRLLRVCKERTSRPVVVMSGIDDRDQVRTFRDLGASAVLVGASLSCSPDPLTKLEELGVGR